MWSSVMVELPGPKVIKLFFVLNWAEREIFSANRFENALIFISRGIFMLSYV